MKGNEQIYSAVKGALDQYFLDLDGEPPSSIYNMVLSCVERPLLQVVLDKAQGNQTKAAELLGINRNTLRKKMQQYDLTNE